MYAEIKSNNKILINRLDDTEKILLKDILEDSKSKEIKFEQVISDDGEFGGIFINLEEPATEPATEPTTEEPATEEPTTEEPTEPATEEPTEPATEEPIENEEPTTENEIQD